MVLYKFSTTKLCCCTHESARTHLYGMRRYADTQIRRHADTQTCRHADTQTCRYADTQTRRCADTQTRKCNYVYIIYNLFHCFFPVIVLQRNKEPYLLHINKDLPVRFLKFSNLIPVSSLSLSLLDNTNRA